ncbi:MAG TPA: ThiF family adenylyltransferase [Tepidisphaeraceae bacterium]|jgi:adenylyltransferase/sulfurtransferase
MERYHRQILLPMIGPTGQERLTRASVLIVGVGALGTVLADYLARAGVGRLTLADRDVVERTNLQRQTLFAQADVGSPKAVAAAERLRAVNAEIDLRAEVVDVAADNIERLVERCGATLLLDGTDNAATRYLLNDVAVKRGLPWVYGGCVGVEGRVMPVLPGITPCLRCVFPEPPTAGEVATCDTAGVLGPAAGVVASLQAAAALRILVGEGAEAKLLTIDAWALRFREIELDNARRPDCPACGLRQFDFLNGPAAQAASLCGRDSVQVRTHVASGFSLDRADARLRTRFDLTRTEYLLKAAVEPGIGLTLFADGRALVHGTSDPVRARAIVSRYLG